MTKQDKVEKVMHEWKAGTLTSNGRKVTDYDQAVAIALSEAGLSKYEGGGGIEEEVPLRADIDGDIYEVIGVNHKLNKVRAKNFSSGDVIEMPIDNWYKESFEFGTQAKFKANGREYVGMVTMKDGQKSISLYNDENYSGDAERIVPFNKIDLKTLKSTMEKETFSKGGNIIERRYVNKDEDYETRYAKNRPSRMGYKDERMFAVGGGIKKYYDVFYSIKGGGSMIAKNIEASSEEEAKEKLTKQMRASSTFDKPIAVIQKFAEGGEMGEFAYGSTETLKVELANNLRDLQGMNKVMRNNDMPKSYVGDAMRLQARNEDLVKELKHRGVNINSILYKEYDKFAVGGELRSFNDRIFGKIIIFKEEQIGKFTIGIKSGFNNNRHVFIYEGKKGSYNSQGLPKNFKMTPQISIADANKIYSELKIKAKNNQNLEPFEIMKDKFAVGGEIGNTVTFSRYGERTTGRVTDKLKNGYEVVTDEGTILVEPQEVISFSDEPIAKKKRFGFFAGGGSVESLLEQRKELLEELINSDIIDEEHGYYDDVRNAIKSNDSEQMREIIDELLSSGLIYKDDWDYRLARKLSKEGRKFEGGGEIENKIEKLKKVVSSKMLPESVKAKAQAEIDKLEKELHESKETKAEEKEEHKAGGSEFSKDELNRLIRSFEEINDFYEKNKKEPIEESDMGERMLSYTLKGLRKQDNKIKILLPYDKFNLLKKSKEGKAEDYIEAKTKALEKSLKDKTISETQRKRDEKELALFKGEEAKKPTTTSKKEVVGYAIVDPISGEIVVSKKTIRQLIEASEKLEKTKGFEDMGDLAYEIIKKDDKNVLGDKIKSVDIKSLPIGKKPTTRKAPIRKAVVKKKVEGLKPKFKVGDVVLVNYGEEKGVVGAIETVAYYEKYPQSMKPTDIPYYEIKGAGKEVSENNLELYKKPKADHKKLVAKLKAKKGGKEYSNRASLVPFTETRRKRNESSDKKREALPLGKRVSESGRTYYETRLNRGDISKEDKFEGGGEVKGSDWGLNLNW